MPLRSVLELGVDTVAQCAAAATVLLTAPVLKRMRDVSATWAAEPQEQSIADTFEQIYEYGSRMRATINLIELRTLLIEQEAARRGLSVPASAGPFLHDVQRIQQALREHLDELRARAQNPRSRDFMQAIELFQKRLRIEEFGAEFSSPRSGAWSFTAAEWGPIADTLLRRAESKLPLELQRQTPPQRQTLLGRQAPETRLANAAF